YISGRLSAVGLNIIAKPISWNAGGYLAQIMDNDGDRGLHLFGRNVYIRDPLYLLAELFEHPNREFGWHNTAVTQAGRRPGRRRHRDPHRATHRRRRSPKFRLAGDPLGFPHHRPSLGPRRRILPYFPGA